MKIAHISDIHIRLYHREIEYREVLNHLIKNLSHNKPDIIVITGDLFHNKTKLSPEAMDLALLYLSSIKTIAKTYVIVGNHDAVVKNGFDRKNTFDPLKKIYRDYDNIIFSTESEIFNFSENVVAVHYSCLDDVKHSLSDIKDAFKIALYHGQVNGWTNNHGMTFNVDSERFKMSDFDLVLLGDIHKTQKIGDNAFYAGSLICQDFGEHPTQHGIIYYDIDTTQKTFKHQFVSIPNPYAYFSLYVQNYELDNKSEKLVKFITEHSNVRVFYNANEDLGDIKLLIKKTLPPNIKKISYEKNESENIKNSISEKINLESIFDVKYHTKLFTEKFKDIVKDEDLQKILSFHQEVWEDSIVDINSLKDERGVSSSWDLIDLSFSNTFNYGENNYINFQNLHGTVGLFSTNGMGKSALLDTISYALFGSFPNMKRLFDVVNRYENSCSTSINLLINNHYYNIVRFTKKVKDNKTSSEVKLVRLDDGKEWFSKEATKEINALIGTLTQFQQNSYINQSRPELFLFMSPAERKTWFVNNLGLDIFEILNEKAKKISKNEAIKLHVIESQYPNNDIEKYLFDKFGQKNILVEEAKNIESQLSLAEKKETTINEEIQTLKTKIQELDSSVSLPIPSFTQIQSQMNEDLILIEENKTLIDNLNNEIISLREKVKHLDSSTEDVITTIKNSNSIDNFKYPPLESALLELTQIKNNGIEAKNKIQLLSIKREEHKDKSIEDLKTQCAELLVKIEHEKTLYENALSNLKNTKLKNSILLDSYKKDLNKLNESVEILSSDDRFTTEDLCKTCPLLSSAFKSKKTIDDIICKISEIEKVNYSILEKELSESETKMISYKKSYENTEKSYQELVKFIAEYNTVEETYKNLQSEYRKKEAIYRELNESKSQHYEQFIKSKIDEENIKTLQLIRAYENTIQQKEFEKAGRYEKNNILLSSIEERKKIIQTKPIYEKYISDKKQLNDVLFEKDILLKEVIELKKQLVKNGHQIETTLKILENDISKIERDLATVKDLNTKIKIHELFISATHKNGIPLDVITNTLSILSQEVNNILKRLSDYHISFYMDDDNIIVDASHVEKGNINAERLCGMESFIFNLAIRLGMVQLTQMPISSSLIVDEGFSALDADNMQSLNSLLEYIKVIYKNTFIVSHDMSMWDMVDYNVEITKTENKAYVFVE